MAVFKYSHFQLILLHIPCLKISCRHMDTQQSPELQFVVLQKTLLAWPGSPAMGGLHSCVRDLRHSSVMTAPRLKRSGGQAGEAWHWSNADHTRSHKHPQSHVIPTRYTNKRRIVWVENLKKRKRLASRGIVDKGQINICVCVCVCVCLMSDTCSPVSDDLHGWNTQTHTVVKPGPCTVADKEI